MNNFTLTIARFSNFAKLTDKVLKRHERGRCPLTMVDVSPDKSKGKLSNLVDSGLAGQIQKILCVTAYHNCSTTGKSTRSFATERVSLDSV
jgi:hypothetical protein